MWFFGDGTAKQLQDMGFPHRSVLGLHSNVFRIMEIVSTCRGHAKQSTSFRVCSPSAIRGTGEGYSQARGEGDSH